MDNLKDSLPRLPPQFQEAFDAAHAETEFLDRKDPQGFSYGVDMPSEVLLPRALALFFTYIAEARKACRAGELTVAQMRHQVPEAGDTIFYHYANRCIPYASFEVNSELWKSVRKHSKWQEYISDCNALAETELEQFPVSRRGTETRAAIRQPQVQEDSGNAGAAPNGPTFCDTDDAAEESRVERPSTDVVALDSMAARAEPAESSVLYPANPPSIARLAGELPERLAERANSPERPALPKPTLPLEVLEAIAEIEGRLRRLVDGCPTLPGFFLLENDVEKATKFMLVGVSEAFRARVEYYAAQSGFCRAWLDEAANETIAATLDVPGIRFWKDSRYRKSLPSIGRELRKILEPLIEEWANCIDQTHKQKGGILSGDDPRHPRIVERRTPIDRAYWRNLLSDFEKLQGHRFILIWSPRPLKREGEFLQHQHCVWTEFPDPSLKARLSALALRGARALGYESEEDWYDQLGLSDFVRFEMTGSTAAERAGGMVETKWGRMDVVKESITLCYKLEAMPESKGPVIQLLTNRVPPIETQPAGQVVYAGETREPGRAVPTVEVPDTALAKQLKESTSQMEQAAEGIARPLGTPPHPMRGAWLETELALRDWNVHNLQDSSEDMQKAIDDGGGRDQYVDLLLKIVNMKTITIETWAKDHNLGRTTVFDWKAARLSGKAPKGKVSDKKIADIEKAIQDDAAALGLTTRTHSD